MSAAPNNFKLGQLEVLKLCLQRAHIKNSTEPWNMSTSFAGKKIKGFTKPEDFGW